MDSRTYDPVKSDKEKVMLAERKKEEEELRTKSNEKRKDRMLLWRNVVGLVEIIILMAYLLLKDRLDIPDTLIRVFGILMIFCVIAQSYMIGRSIGGRR